MKKSLFRILSILLVCVLVFFSCTPTDEPVPPAPTDKTAAQEPGNGNGGQENGGEENGGDDNGGDQNGGDDNGGDDNGGDDNGGGGNGGEQSALYPDDDNVPAAPAGPFTNLSASATANCYIVSAPGAYKIKAVKGNGSSSVGTVAKARIIWETVNTDVAPARYSVIESAGVDGNFITFKTPSVLVPGNALIAAFDASGKVLWSWHIWIPATEIGGSTYGISSYKMMSRNLGALVDAEASSSPVDSRALGLHYQWGRKDPFPAQAVAGFGMTLSGAKINDAKSIEQPTLFANVNGDWNTTSNGDFWGDKSSAKTIYDPCPAGYKVPKREDATGIFRTDLTSANGWQYNADAHWFTTGKPVAVFPLPGYFGTDGNITGFGTSTDIWNSHHDGDVPSNAYGQYIYEGPKSVISAQTKARGGSVRCVSVTIEPFTNAEGMPVQGSYTRTVFDSSVQELSGICFSADRDFIWGVGDEGDIYKISLDFQTVTKYLSTGSDLEDVTIHPVTKDLYFAKEADRVDKLAAPAYSSKTKAFYVEEAANFGNSGLEGIAYYKNDVLYVGAQTGATLWAYKLDGTKIWKKQLGTIAAQIEEVGGLCYDAEKDWLWVTDSEAHKLFVFDGEVTELLAMYDVSFVGNAESVLVDRPNGCVYVGDDGSTSKIYRIEFTNL
ncbi:MAG: hypothetical protein J5695_03785 [Bacteroidales bacterium]|nr:hypothetical protein [Bacteroidales bacterium]